MTERSWVPIPAPNVENSLKIMIKCSVMLHEMSKNKQKESWPKSRHNFMAFDWWKTFSIANQNASNKYCENSLYKLSLLQWSRFCARFLTKSGLSRPLSSLFSSFQYC